MTARPVASVIVVVTWASVAIVTTCWLEAAIMQVRERDASWVAPPAAGTRANPLQNRPEAAAGGGKLFEQRCTTCHGEDGRGTSKAPDLTQPDVQAQTDGALFWKISSGNTHAGMPAFSFLPELQRWQLVLHLRAAQDSKLTTHH
jgi:mono/diheme cytochrome c family protein